LEQEPNQEPSEAAPGTLAQIVDYRPPPAGQSVGMLFLGMFIGILLLGATMTIAGVLIAVIASITDSGPMILLLAVVAWAGGLALSIYLKRKKLPGVLMGYLIGTGLAGLALTLCGIMLRGL